MTQKQQIRESWSAYQSMGTEVVLPDWTDFAVLHKTGIAVIGRRGNMEAPRAMAIPGLDDEFVRLGPAARPNGYRLIGHVNGTDIMIVECFPDIDPALTLIAQRDEPVALVEAT